MLQLLLLVGIIVIINVLLSSFFFRVDLTEEKRFSISEPTKTLLKEQEDILFTFPAI